MAKNKYSSKRIRNNYQSNVAVLQALSETFVNVLMEHNFNYEDEDVKSVFKQLDDKWRTIARRQINAMPAIYKNDSQKRSNLTNTFTVMIRNMQAKQNQPIKEVMNIETPQFDWKTKNVEKIIEAFKITLPNFNTKARTIKGLTPYYEALEPDQKMIFEESLKELDPH